MQAQELFLASGKSAGVFYCTSCKVVRKTHEEAEDCCSPCKCQQCGVETEHYNTICKACQRKKERAAEVARFEKAEKLTSFDGWLFYGDKYYETMCDLLDDIDDDADIPEYVWATTVCHFVRLEIGAVEELSVDVDSAYEDFDSAPDGLDELKTSIEAFNKANAHHISYMVDYSKAVLVSKEKTC